MKTPKTRLKIAIKDSDWWWWSEFTSVLHRSVTDMVTGVCLAITHVVQSQLLQVTDILN